MLDNNVIIVPDYLPNNLRSIRDMRKLTVKQVADDLKIDRNFLAAVEMESKNFSGKSTIRALKYYNINFYKMYDVKDMRELPVTDVFSTQTYSNTFKFKVNYLNDLIKHDTNIKDKDLSSGKIIDYINNSGLMKKELKNFIESNFTDTNYVLNEYDIKNISINGDIITVDTDIVLGIIETKYIEFDINFVKYEDVKLTDFLLYRGFPETITFIEEDIDNTRAKIEGNTLILDKEYKIPVNDNIKDFIITNKFEMNSNNIEIKYDKLRDTQIARFKAIRNEINNLKAIRTIANISIEEMHQCLGLSYNGYINLELGNQKISSKIMWRLVNKLRIPLETVINIDEYFERFCRHDEKIKKERNKDNQ